MCTRHLLIAAFLVAVGSATAHAAATVDRYPHVAAAYLVQVGDETLWAGGINKRLPPASLTKLMTALLVLESYRPDEVVTVGKDAAAETGSRLGLRAGDRMTVAGLLAGAILRSGNDACHALADWRAGSEAQFVALMNARASELGLRDTRFANACGFDAAGHYSSVRDLSVLAHMALRFPVFSGLVAQHRATFQTVDGQRTFRVTNTNALVGTYPGAIGIKSGYTSRAGRCLIGLVERGGVRVLVVMLNARNRWWNAVGLFERAFERVSHAR
jgi:D-alanyl-D-alanine carboxypeptidase (penicillin-binding protein 5/6)